MQKPSVKTHRQETDRQKNNSDRRDKKLSGRQGTIGQTYRQTDIQTNRQIDIQTDRQTKRHKDRQIDRQTDRHTGSQADKQVSQTDSKVRQ